MTRLFGLLVVIVLVVAVIGYFRGWFAAESHHDANGQRTLTVTVDKDKINQDKASVQQEVHDLEHK